MMKRTKTNKSNAMLKGIIVNPSSCRVSSCESPLLNWAEPTRKNGFPLHEIKTGMQTSLLGTYPLIVLFLLERENVKLRIPMLRKGF